VELSQLVIALTIVVFLLYAFHVRSIIWDRVALAGLGGVGIVLALQPNLATRVANVVGVGRGTDLLVYVFILYSLFHNLHVGSRLRSIEQQLTQIVRAAAIDRHHDHAE
jgi:hypothetical protein